MSTPPFRLISPLKQSPSHQVADYNTRITGLDHSHLYSCLSRLSLVLAIVDETTTVSAWPFEMAIAEVKRKMHDKIVIGHSLWHHFSVCCPLHATLVDADSLRLSRSWVSAIQLLTLATSPYFYLSTAQCVEMAAKGLPPWTVWSPSLCAAR